MLNMRYLALVCLAVAAAMAAPSEEKYSDKYDNINVKEITENKRLLNSYGDCVLGRGRCTPEGTALKDHLQDALETGCEKCTDKQKEGTKIVITHLIKEEKPLWKELTDKFDPEGKWREKYEKEAKEQGIEIPE